MAKDGQKAVAGTEAAIEQIGIDIEFLIHFFHVFPMSLPPDLRGHYVQDERAWFCRSWVEDGDKCRVRQGVPRTAPKRVSISQGDEHLPTTF